jgi:hypothetical protein
MIVTEWDGRPLSDAPVALAIVPAGATPSDVPPPLV